MVVVSAPDAFPDVQVSEQVLLLGEAIDLYTVYMCAFSSEQA
jgi:hypothetical protein